MPMSIQVWEYGSNPSLANQAGTFVQIVAGTPVTTSEEFIGDFGLPLVPLAGFPKVSIFDNLELVTQGMAYAKTPNSGLWFCDLTIPPDFDFGGSQERVLTVQWEFQDSTGSKTKNSLHISVIPQSATTEDSTIDVIQLVPAPQINLKVPYIVTQTDTAKCSVYSENTCLNVFPKSMAQIQGSSTVLTFPVNMTDARLQPYNLITELTLNGATRQVFSQLYLLNPSMLSAMQSLDLAINKANQLEAIPGLRFREIDLMQGLIRGLDHFNSIGPSLTSFNGVNMQGPIREAWLICTSIRVLRAQLQAEGWFNFDFSGQNVSLNIDRSQAISDALSFYEGQVDTTIKPLKMLLAKKGVIQGDGSQGAVLASISQMGMTVLSNNSITRSRYGGTYRR
jgi:hypothetical protein